MSCIQNEHQVALRIEPARLARDGQPPRAQIGLRGLISAEELLEAIGSRADGVEIVVTGRGAPRELVERADLVTEMRAVKHYFDGGAGARVGIEK